MDSANYLKDLGARIKARRKEMDLSQSDVATVVGVTPGAVGHWEAGISQVELARIPLLAEALGTSVAYIVGEAPAGAVSRSLDSLRLEAIKLIAVADRADVAGVLLALKGKPHT